MNFDANGGTGGFTQDISVDLETISSYGEVSATIPSTEPTRDGYTFFGWHSTKYEDGKYTLVRSGNIAGTEIEVFDGETFYAIWIPAEITITYNVNLSSASPSSIAAEKFATKDYRVAEYDSYFKKSYWYVKVPVTEKEVSATAYQFYGWTSNSSMSGKVYTATTTGVKQAQQYSVKVGETITVIGDETLYGVYATKIKITFHGNNHDITGEDPTVTQYVLHGEAFTLRKNMFEKNGTFVSYSYKGWSKTKKDNYSNSSYTASALDYTDEEYIADGLTSDLTLYAVWIKY